MYLTVAQTPLFEKYASQIWSEEELDQFIDWIANNPVAGDVIPGGGGLRKVRWTAAGRGKRGGVRVIYYNVLRSGTIWLLIAYTKTKFDNLPPNLLKELRNEIVKEKS